MKPKKSPLQAVPQEFIRSRLQMPILEVLKVLREENRGCYIYRKEIWLTKEELPIVVKSAYNSMGNYIGEEKVGESLKKRNIENIQLADHTHTVCSIGFNKEKQVWYAWSDNTIDSFGVGSMCTKDDPHYKPAVGKQIAENLSEAKQMAKAYAININKPKARQWKTKKK